MGVQGEDSSKTINVMPGHLTFVEPLTILNDSTSIQHYKVEIFDPDMEFLNAPELQLVHDESELKHWVARGKLPRQTSFSRILPSGDFMLQPKESVDLLFKFLTKREVSMSLDNDSNKFVIRPRKVRIFILLNRQRTSTAWTFDILPSMTPIDHTFRFFEPEHSHYQVALPPFMHIGHTGATVELSNPECRAEMIRDTAIFTVAGRTGDVMSV